MRVERGEEIVGDRTDEAPPFAQVIAELDRQIVADVDPQAGGQLRARTSQGLPPPIAAIVEQQHLGRPAGRPVEPDTRGQHAGVVQHDDVARADQVGQVAGVAVLHRSPTEGCVDEQTRRVALDERVLGDAFGRELVVELVEEHAWSASRTGRATRCRRLSRSARPCRGGDTPPPSPRARGACA